MKQVIWTQTYDVNTIVLDTQKRLGLFGLLNLLQGRGPGLVDILVALAVLFSFEAFGFGLLLDGVHLRPECVSVGGHYGG